jgi:ribosomal protein L18
LVVEYTPINGVIEQRKDAADVVGVDVGHTDKVKGFKTPSDGAHGWRHKGLVSVALTAVDEDGATSSTFQ